MDNKVHSDVQNCTLFPVTVDETTGALSFGTPVKLKGLISLDLSAEGDQVKIRADGIDYYVVYGNNGYSGDMNFVMVDDAFKVQFLGEILTGTDNVQIENANAEPTAFALAFEFKGDKKNRRHILYNCIASRPNLAGDNKDNPKEPDTETLSITCSPMENGNVKASTTDTTPDSSLYPRVTVWKRCLPFQYRFFGRKRWTRLNYYRWCSRWRKVHQIMTYWGRLKLIT